MAEATQSASEEVQAGAGPGDQGSAWVGVLILLLFIVAVVFLVFLVSPPPFKPPKDAGFIDGIFANRPVMAATRIVLLSVGVMLLFAAIFIITSIIVRMTRGEWLQRFGPFEVQEASQELQTAREEIDRLTGLLAEDDSAERLRESDALIEDLAQELDHKERRLEHAQAEIVRLRGEQPPEAE